MSGQDAVDAAGHFFLAAFPSSLAGFLTTSGSRGQQRENRGRYDRERYVRAASILS
jgi:hypothetical protein